MVGTEMFDAIIVIRCRKDQVLEIIEHVKSRFKDVDVTYEVITTEL
jgi:hypothetical protein